MRIASFSERPPVTYTTYVPPLLNLFLDAILPLLRAKDVLAFSSTCKKWRQITSAETVSQKIWEPLCHCDFPNSRYLSQLSQAYACYAAHMNPFTFRFRNAEPDGLFEASKGITSIFSAHEKLIIVYQDGNIKIWDLETKNCENTFTPIGEVRACFFNGDDLIVGLSNGIIVGWSIEEKEWINFTHRHSSSVICFGETENYFLSMSCKGEVILWDRQFNYVDKAREWAQLNQFTLLVSSMKTSLICCQTLMAFSNKNIAYAVTGFDQKKFELLVENDVRATSTYMTGEKMMVYFADGTLRFFDPHSKSSAIASQQENCSISSLSFDDSRFVLNSIEGDEIQILDFKYTETT